MSDSSVHSTTLSSSFRDDEVIVQLQHGLHLVPTKEATSVCLEAIIEERKRLQDVLSEPSSIASVDILLKIRRAFYIAQIWVELSVSSETGPIESFAHEIKTLFEVVFEALNLKLVHNLAEEDFFTHIKALDEIKIICSKLLSFGKLFPSIDLDLFSQLSMVHCTIVDHVSSSFKQQLQTLIDSRVSPLESITVKTRIMDEMRYLAYRFKGISNQIIDLIGLQAAFEFTENISWMGFVTLMTKLNMQRVHCKKFGSSLVFLSPALLQDESLFELFMRARVNCSRSIAEFHVIIVRNVPEMPSVDLDQINETTEETLSRLIEQSVHPITVISHSTVELRILTTKILKIDGISEILQFKPLNTNGAELIFSKVVGRIEKSMDDFALTIASLLASNTYEERQASSSDRVLCDEGSRSALIAVSYVYQHLLDARHKTEGLQMVFEIMITGGLLWVALELSLYAKGEDSDWVSFFLIKTLELMNSIMVRNIFDPFEWTELISKVERNVIPLLNTEPTPEEETKKAYIVDQCQALLRQFNRTERGTGRLRHSLGRFPDQLLLETHNLYIFSMMKTARCDVFKCLNLISRKIVTVKRFPKPDPKSNTNGRNEIDLLRGLKHLNVIGFLDSFESGDHQFLVLENCEFGLISSQNGQLPEQEIREIGRQILHGLSYLHSHHIVHNNLRPRSIKRTGLGFIKISEFGNAQMTDSSLEEKQISFQTLSGTSPYVAPESILQLQVDTPSDIWSFGCILGKLISGQEPWSYLPENEKLSIVHVLTSSNRPPYDIGLLECSSIGKDVLKSIFNTNPSKRPSASELLKHPYFSDLPNSII